MGLPMGVPTCSRDGDFHDFLIFRQVFQFFYDFSFTPTPQAAKLRIQAYMPKWEKSKTPEYILEWKQSKQSAIKVFYTGEGGTPRHCLFFYRHERWHAATIQTHPNRGKRTMSCLSVSQWGQRTATSWCPHFLRYNSDSMHTPRSTKQTFPLASSIANEILNIDMFKGRRVARSPSNCIWWYMTDDIEK